MAKPFSNHVDSMTRDIRITVLMNNEPANDSAGASLQCEHGFSLWIEYNNKHVLFDTGQSRRLLHNAGQLGIDLAMTDAIILSHGHYDHTGGLAEVLRIAPMAEIYLHPDATRNKYGRKGDVLRYNGMPHDTIRGLSGHRIHLTPGPRKIFPGFIVTGEIPRVNTFEDTGGDFFRDEQGKITDELPDDQALFIEFNNGRIIILGCCHSGVINTLNYIDQLTGPGITHAIIGGMHLLHADVHRIDSTIKELHARNIGRVIPLHCTGNKAVTMMKKSLGYAFVEAGTGSVFTIAGESCL